MTAKRKADFLSVTLPSPLVVKLEEIPNREPSWRAKQKEPGHFRLSPALHPMVQSFYSKIYVKMLKIPRTHLP